MMSNQIEEIFISYRWGNKKDDSTFEAFVRAIEESTGLKAFWDVESLRSGTLADKLRKRVASSYVFMPIVTENYLAFSTEGNREEGKDYCLLEYETALLNNVKIIPIFVGPEGDIFTADEERVRQAATNTAKGVYDKSDLDLLKKHLLSQKGIPLSSITAEELSQQGDTLATLVFDQFCRSDQVPYFKDVLDAQAKKWNPVRICGDFDDAGLTLDNSYIPLTFQRHFTQAEKKEKEDKRESTAPVDLPETQLLSTLDLDRYAVVVGDAGQGKSSYARRLTIDLGREAQVYGLSKDHYFPLYFECKNIDPKSLTKREDFLTELANDANLSRAALESVLCRGKPLLIFDAMDEIAPAQMDRVIKAIYDFVVCEKSNVYCLFTSRLGQKMIAAGDMTLDHTERTIVRRYTVKPFDEDQRDAFIDRLAVVKGIETAVKEEFLDKLKEKEGLAYYQAVSRNPFVLLTVFTEYDAGEDLPATRFDAIRRVIDNTIARDLGKEEYKSINVDDIKVVLGAVSCELYCQRDEGKVPRAKAQMLEKYTKELFADKQDVFDRFFRASKLFDNSGFCHEFLASTYAAYYLLNIMERQKAEGEDPAEADEMAWLSHDADYWKGVTEALLCLIDRTSRSSKTYLEPILDKLQEVASPDYDTLCSAVSQFTEHQPRGAQSLLTKMLGRGCKGILDGEETGDYGFNCKGVNPYEELFYYPAIYPIMQQYLPNLPARTDERDIAYLHNELRKEVCALFGNDAQTELRKLYDARDVAAPELSRKLQKAAYRTKNARGYVCVPKWVFTIESFSFAGCSGLTAITLPVGVISIEYGAFWGCSGLTAIALPEGVSIRAFWDRRQLRSIKEHAFRGCSGLTVITIPKSVTDIDGSAFAGCSNLTSLTVAKGNSVYHSDKNCIVDSATNTLVVGCKTSEIPSYVTAIGKRAFEDCSGLTSITIPEGVISIGVSAFDGCSNLVSLTVAKGNSVYHSEGNCIIHTETKVLVVGCKTSDIPSYVTAIGEDAFDGCSGLTSIAIPEGVTSIGEWAFKDCSGLTTITLPNRLTSIGYCAFENCSGLTSITIPEGVITIEDSAFKGCSGLTSITIPEGVAEIGDSAFKYCIGLTSITLPECVTSIGEDAFDGCSNLISLTVAKGNSVYHSEGNCIIHTETKVLVVGCKTSEIPSYVTAIGEDAFDGCSGLTSITIPEGSISIEAYAFWDCRGLTSITIPESVAFIGEGAFGHCCSLKDIYYRGTTAQWLAIDKNQYALLSDLWDKNTGRYVVHCTDGDLVKRTE